MMKKYNETNRDQTFDRWNNLKKSLDRNDRAPGFNAGDMGDAQMGLQARLMSQARTISSARLIERIGRLGDNDYQNVKKDLYGILFTPK